MWMISTKSEIAMKGVHIITEMELIADEIDEKDSSQEGSPIVTEQYQSIGTASSASQKKENSLQKYSRNPLHHRLRAEDIVAREIIYVKPEAIKSQ